MVNAVSRVNRTALRPAVRLLIILGWSALTVLELRAFMPDNPLRVTNRVADNLTLLAPQGWIFFTRNPREAVDRVYRGTNPCCEMLTLPNNHASYLFGVKRDGRAFAVEMGPLLKRIPGKAWRECRGDLPSCVAGLPVPSRTVANTSATRFACGKIIVQRQHPIPWAWSSNRNLHPPYSVAILNVSCE